MGHRTRLSAAIRTEHPGTAHIEDTGNAELAGNEEYVERAHKVDAHSVQRISAAGRCQKPGKMDDGVAVFRRQFHGAGIGDIAGAPVHGTGRGLSDDHAHDPALVVQIEDPHIVARRKHGPGYPGANETATACDQNSHPGSRLLHLSRGSGLADIGIGQNMLGLVQGRNAVVGKP